MSSAKTRLAARFVYLIINCSVRLPSRYPSIDLAVSRERVTRPPISALSPSRSAQVVAHLASERGRIVHTLKNPIAYAPPTVPVSGWVAWVWHALVVAIIAHFFIEHVGRAPDVAYPFALSGFYFWRALAPRQRVVRGFARRAAVSDAQFLLQRRAVQKLETGRALAFALQRVPGGVLHPRLTGLAVLAHGLRAHQGAGERRVAGAARHLVSAVAVQPGVLKKERVLAVASPGVLRVGQLGQDRRARQLVALQFGGRFRRQAPALLRGRAVWHQHRFLGRDALFEQVVLADLVAGVQRATLGLAHRVVVAGNEVGGVHRGRTPHRQGVGQGGGGQGGGEERLLVALVEQDYREAG